MKNWAKLTHPNPETSVVSAKEKKKKPKKIYRGQVLGT